MRARPNRSHLIVALFLPALLGFAPVRGSDQSCRGGEMSVWRGGEPASLNPIVAEGHDSVDIQFQIIEPLLIRDLQTYQWVPALADHWKVLPGGRDYEFHIRPHAVWSDGVKITAEDVKFSFDVIFNPAFPTAHMRPYYEGISSVEIRGPNVVRFHAKNDYFLNFLTSAGLPIVPKHIYGNPKVGPFLSQTIVGSGPYMMDRWEHGARISLRRNPLWWGLHAREYQHAYNPDRLTYRFAAGETMALELLKQGQVDFMNLSAEAFTRTTSSSAWGQRAFKVQIENAYPKTQHQVLFNLDKPLFQDLNVRRALSHLYDRATAVQKFDYGASVPARGPWYVQSDFADPSVNEISFDPAFALSLLRQSNWLPSKEGVLRKNGKPLQFTILTPSKVGERYLTLLQTDAQKVGVKIKIQNVEPSLFYRALRERKFDAVYTVAGGGLVDFDPNGAWNSAAVETGGNFAGYRNAQVDNWLDRARHTPDFELRKKWLRKIYRRIAADVPGIFLFDESRSFYASSDRVGRPVDTYRYEVGLKYWWVKSACGGQLAQVSR